MSGEITATTVAAQERLTASSQVVSFNALYQNTITSIMTNEDLSSEEREKQVEAAQVTLDKQIAFVENFYSIDLAW